MNLDNEKVKNFLLETVETQKDRTIKKQLLYFRNGNILCLIVCLWMLYLTTFNSENANAGTVIIFILTILLTLITVMLNFKKHQHQVKSWKIEDDSTETPRKDKSFYGTIGGIITAIIILLYNNNDFSETMVMIFVITTMFLGVMVASNAMCIYQHKLYLLKKYCPEIKDLKATEIQ
jgi:cell division protein FtsW (lipid II flippase)